MPRKKPFSNKQKKKQLQVKRERKRGNVNARLMTHSHGVTAKLCSVGCRGTGNGDI